MKYSNYHRSLALISILASSLYAAGHAVMTFALSLVPYQANSPADAIALDRVRQASAPSIASPLTVFKAFIARALKHTSFIGDHYALE